jgi:hypothetical protein
MFAMVRKARRICRQLEESYGYEEHDSQQCCRHYYIPPKGTFEGNHFDWN